MFKHLLLTTLAVIMLGSLFAPFAAAQSAEEVDALMREIRDKMRELEQMLAKASLDPADTQPLLDMLRRAIESGDTSNLPQELQEFLRNNPDTLSRLAAGDDATPEEQAEVENRIRELLRQDDGVQQLLEENPELLEKLLDDQEAITEALRRHVEVEDDIKRLFEQTESQMQLTEEQLKDLIELAEQMQQQMQGQGEGQPMEQQGEQPGEQEGDRPSHQEGNTENPNQAPDNYDPPPSGTGSGTSDVDPNAWRDVTPARDRDDTSGATQEPVPEGYDEEWNNFFRRLAERSSAGDGNTDDDD